MKTGIKGIVRECCREPMCPGCDRGKVYVDAITVLSYVFVDYVYTYIRIAGRTKSRKTASQEKRVIFFFLLARSGAGRPKPPVETGLSVAVFELSSRIARSTLRRAPAQWVLYKSEQVSFPVTLASVRRLSFLVMRCMTAGPCKGLITCGYDTFLRTE